MKKSVFLMFSIMVLMFSMCFVANVQAYAYPVSAGQEVYVLKLKGTTNGGLFGIYAWGSDDLLFSTFCIETNEYVYTGKNNKHRVEALNTAAVHGGSGGPDPDPLDARTAYLYDNFSRGTLSGFDGSTTAIDDLQKAIWYIEQENGGVNNDFVSLAQSAIDNGDWSGIDPVRVVNLQRWASVNGQYQWVDAQDQLVTVPEPSTMLLLGFGLIGLTIVGGRRFVK